MTPFYRYLRPIKFDERRVELDTLPRGGVCLRFEKLDDSLWFTHSRCRNDELFSKEVAKRIADTRAKTAITRKQHVLGHLGKLPIVKGTDELMSHVVDFCLNWEPPEDSSLHVRHYLRVTQRELGNALRELMVQNQMEKQKAEIWKAGIAAAGHTARYEQASYGR